MKYVAKRLSTYAAVQHRVCLGLLSRKCLSANDTWSVVNALSVARPIIWVGAFAFPQAGLSCQLFAYKPGEDTCTSY